ncbi:MAG: CBS domain-containing protein [Caldilineaceae bacterium]
MSVLAHSKSVILTHEHTDFDALASMLGAALLFPGALAILPRQLNRNVRDFVTLYKNQFPFLAPEDVPRTTIRQVILVDTRTASFPKGVRKDASYLIIDHHPLSPMTEEERSQVVPFPGPLSSHENRTPADAKEWVDPVGAATTLLVERLIDQQLRPTSLQATLLALGIHEDTGSLTFASTTPRDVRALAWLLECGANLSEINHFLHHPLSDEQHHLMEQLLAQSEALTIAGHTVVIAQATAKGFQEEISALAGRLRDFFESDALFLIILLGDIIQVVARSTTDAIDVGEITRRLGGGGHARAAAATLHIVSLSTVRQRLLRALEQQSRSGITVGQIMSVGRPQVLAPDLRIDEALVLMRRYGHEGFPVVETTEGGEEKLLGVLTRREADRAWSHGLHKEPISRFMRTGAITITPDAPVSQLRRLMVEHDWGQIPVVDDAGQIIGIVTRTDLIKLWGESPTPEYSASEIAERMKAALSPIHHHILQLIGKEAADNNQRVYVVGGFVRDLLLKIPALKPELHTDETEENSVFDLDVVIEGDAILFAHHMQRKFGGKVVIHRQFGTAKWLLNHPEQQIDRDALLSALEQRDPDIQLPESLDFVTARTEFYTAPTVLPTVESSSIKLDLHRRDFTINTLALCLSPNRWGVLLDFYGGVNDLNKRLIRVLHSISFIDDPTRILRAVRYEQRFNFQIEERTLELLHDARELLKRVTAARIRHELQRIFLETVPERTLLRLGELGVLAEIHPQLPSDGALSEIFPRLRGVISKSIPAPNWVTAYLPQKAIGRAYFSLMTLHMPRQALIELNERLQWDKGTERLVWGLHELESAADQLSQPNVPPSRVVMNLEKADLHALALFWVVHQYEERLRAVIERYHNEWRFVRAQTTAKELEALHIAPGPIYSIILEGLRTARLDGEVVTKENERDWIYNKTGKDQLQN